MESINYLNSYYEQYDENSRLLSKTGNVEFWTTMHYIEKFLRPGVRILEIGAGTGRYSHALAQKGYRVDAVELIGHNIEIFKQHTVEGEPVTIVQGNATDLSAFESNTYDVTLLLGPMYHLFEKPDKDRALSEAIRVTKPGGVVFAAYCMSDPAILQAAFIRGRTQELIEKGMLNPETFETFSHPWDLFELYRKDQIDALRTQFDVTQLHYVAADGLVYYMRQTMEEMNDADYALFLKYHLATCERPELTGHSNHTLDIFRKNKSENV